MRPYCPGKGMEIGANRQPVNLAASSGNNSSPFVNRYQDAQLKKNRVLPGTFSNSGDDCPGSLVPNFSR